MRPRKPLILLAALLSTSAVPPIQAGEATGSDWAFTAPTRSEPPVRAELKHAERVLSPIDQFVLRRLEDEELEPAPPADRVTLVRRAYFDLLGLPPTPEQVESFVADSSEAAWSQLIDTLLESKHYGERWARHWLDVARYADSGGYETDIYYRNAWRYRDYVVKSFNDDKPYDIFVQEQIAGDELWPDNLDLDPRRVYVVSDKKRRHLEARIATGFYALGPRVHESGLDAKRFAYETRTDWIDTTASAFMGLTLACSRCHDHKFDPFTQQDYFSLHAVFASAREVDLPLWTAMEEADWRQSFPKIVAVDEARKTYERFVAQIGEKPTPQQEKRKQELLAAVGQAVLNLPQRAAGQAAVEYEGLMHIPTASVLGRVHPALMDPVHVLVRGELNKPKERVEPALPLQLAKATGVDPALGSPFSSRKDFALWLTRPDHPLTARVMVNRIWQWHFGRGIVETPNDFGAMGQPPSHPELLDWLATEFVASGWKVKALHRLIMDSATYRQSSRVGDARHLDVDPDNNLLWRMNRRRLEGEALWDSVHAAAGTLNLSMGGRPIVPPLADDEIASLRDKWHWVVTSDPKQHTRRGLYIIVRRNFKFPMFEVFDAPVTSASCPTRDVTTVAPQALWGLNNRSVLRQAMHFAARVAKEATPTSVVTGTAAAGAAGATEDHVRGAQVDRAWRIALGRAPTGEEVSSSLRLLTQLEAENAPLDDPPAELAALPPERAQALSKFCLALFNLSEFAFVD